MDMASAKEGGTRFNKELCEVKGVENQAEGYLESVHEGSCRLSLVRKLNFVVMFFFFFHVFFLPRKDLCLFLFFLFCLLRLGVQAWVKGSLCLWQGKNNFKAARPEGHLLQRFRQVLGKAELKPATENVGILSGSLWGNGGQTGGKRQDPRVLLRGGMDGAEGRG